MVVIEKSVYIHFRDLRITMSATVCTRTPARQGPVIQGPTRRVARASAAVQRHCDTKEPTNH